jgi:hypothetical protein
MPERLSCRRDQIRAQMNSTIRNGLYHITVEMLDGIQDGTMRGGDSFFYAFGTCTSANGKWKGEVTNQEHSTDIWCAADLGTQGGDNRIYRHLYR